MVRKFDCAITPKCFIMSSFVLVGKQEKDPNDTLNKSQDDGKPAEDGDDNKGGFFNRVSSRSSHDQHELNHR